MIYLDLDCKHHKNKVVDEVLWCDSVEEKMFHNVTTTICHISWAKARREDAFYKHLLETI